MPGLPPDLREDLASAIRQFAAYGVLTSAAGLQLLPENAACHSRLHILAHGAAAGLAKGNARLSRGKLARLLNQTAFAKSAGMFEDPLDNPFCEEFHFDGSGYVVFPDPARESIYILRHLIRAALDPGGVLVGTTAESLIREELRILLTLSDEVAYRLDIAPLYDIPELEGWPRDHISAPHPSDLQELQEAVCFAVEDLTALLQEVGASESALSPYTYELGTVPLDAGSIEGLPLDTKPLVQIDDTLVLAAPRFVLTAARNGIIRACAKESLLDELARAYHHSVWSTLVVSLKHLKFNWEHEGLHVDDPCWSTGVFRFDTDKAAYVLLVTDPLEGHDPDGPWSEWDPGNTGNRIAAHLRQAESWLYSACDGLNEILFLPVTQGVGRHYRMAFREDHGPQACTVMMSEACDIETIMFLDRGNDLALWYFARAREQLRKRATVQVWSILDEYHAYRSSNRSFYFSDGALPIFYDFQPGGKGTIRRQVLSRWRFHTLTGPEGSGVEVMRNWDTAEIPSVLLRDTIEEGPQIAVAMAVEDLPIPVWITARDVREMDELDPEAMARLHNLGINFVQMLSYWVWKFSPYLEEPLADTAVDRITIRVQIEHPDEWFGSLRADNSSGTPFLVQAGGADVVVTLHPSFRGLLSDSSNVGERELMRAVLESLASISGIETRTFEPESVAVALEQHAPLGTNKRLAILNTSVTPDLDEVGPLAKYRPVQDRPQSNVLDKLGENLQAQGVKVGPIPKEDRVSLLQNSVVGYLYDELTQLVATLQPRGLYEWLIMHYEALTQRNAYFKFEMPMREAGFSDVLDLPKEFQDTQGELATVRTAARFVIEYVAARPPRGLRPISMSVYDELLATAKHIVDFAFVRDVIEFGLADVGLSMLPSGRLGTNRDEWEEAQSAYLPGFVQSLSRDAASSFVSHFRQQEKDRSTDADPIVLALSDALRDEFGLVLEELRGLYEFLQDSGDPWNSVHALLRDKCLEELAKEMSWDVAKAEVALDLLTLKPRTDFLNPPPPFKREDVYPWIYGRPLSFIRRPLLLRDDMDEEYLYWGPRALRESYTYLLHQCLTGRIKPLSSGSTMDTFRGMVIANRGEEFNDEVADLLSAEKDFVVTKRVDNVGGQKIQEKGNDLGDIDVLVAVPSKRRIAALECKQFSLARNPRELKNEVEKLFHGPGGKRKKAAAQKHLRRTEWLRSHLRDVVRTLGGDEDKEWVVEPALVTDRPLLAPLLTEAPFPVLPTTEVCDWLQR